MINRIHKWCYNRIKNTLFGDPKNFWGGSQIPSAALLWPVRKSTEFMRSLEKSEAILTSFKRISLQTAEAEWRIRLTNEHNRGS